ncbi:MAG: SEC-C metal-binding domain-containing protein [Blastocatellia bacterium]
MLSWVAIDRMAEREMTTNTTFRSMVAHRPFRSGARNKSDEELLERLRAFGIELDQSSLEALCQKALAAEDVAKPLMAKCVFKSTSEKLNGDWIWVCMDALWQRWFPHLPSFERLDDRMQQGYDLMESGRVTDACGIWLEAWGDVLYLFDKAGFKTISEFDGQFMGTQLLFNWIQDLEMELWNAGLDDRQFFVRRIEYCEKVLQMFGAQETSLRESCRRALAASHAELGDPGKSDSLYAEWLKADPQWGEGWVGWADCYWFTRKPFKDVPRAEALLREGLAIKGVREFDFLAERMAELCEEQGRAEEADEYHQKAASHRQATAPASAIQPAAHGVSVKRVIDFGEAGLPLDQLPELTKQLRSSSPLAMGDIRKVGQKVGRNDPCPCGSGKKYKKCCGQ